MNTDNQHFTPAPWKTVQNSTYGSWEVWAKEQPICGVSKEHEKENANLIAAAPDMLQALEYIVESIYGFGLDKFNIKKDFSIINAHANAIKAIRKAKGQ